MEKSRKRFKKRHFAKSIVAKIVVRPVQIDDKVDIDSERRRT